MSLTPIIEQSVIFRGRMRHSNAGLLYYRAATRTSQTGPTGYGGLPDLRIGEAQAHFLRGVAALHSFWYEVALDEFREATKSNRIS